ncbi:MAG: anthranilate phosphoribosyltransferase [Saprospiraceae bacterium]|nr:anthranilate phosphoribosyltransferase [Saprospiraceae bacterium]
MKEILIDLFDQKRLSREEAKSILLDISKGEYNDALLASFLTVFKMRPIAKEELHGFRDALLPLCLSLDLKGRDSIDIVGTGGDNKNTFNISTLTCFVVAGAGYSVTKHGNYGVSSVSGSSNVLEHLGYQFTNNPDEINRRLDRSNMIFLHAPLFHPAMKAVGPVRRALGMKTFFNMLGPLVNPARPKRHFLGVFDMNLSRLYQYILQEDMEIFAIVYNLDGFDEISLTDRFSYRTSDSDIYLSPEALGFASIQAEALHGGDSVPEAATIFMNILEGNGTAEQRNVIYANAGLAIHRFHPERSFEECIVKARESLDGGKALQCLKKASEN